MAIILAMTIFFYLNFTTVVVSGVSMEPTFHDKQRLLASKAYWLVGSLKEKDVVVVKQDEENDYIIKRIYKLPGEVVDWANVPGSYRLEKGEYRVPEGHVYVLGDNREVSEDSRKFGPVPIDHIIGKIVKR